MSNSCYYGAVIGLVVSLFGVVGWAAYAKLRPDQFLRAMHPLIALVHVIIYGIASLILRDCNVSFLELWCSVLKLHLVILVASEGVFHLLREYVIRRTISEHLKANGGGAIGR